MARGALNIGPCYCKTGRQRFGERSSADIPWEHPWDQPLPPHPPTIYAPDSDVEPDSDSNVTDSLDSQDEEEGDESSDNDGAIDRDAGGDEEEYSQSNQDDQDDASQGNYLSQTSNLVPLPGNGTMPVHISQHVSALATPDPQPMVITPGALSVDFTLPPVHAITYPHDLIDIAQVSSNSSDDDTDTDNEGLGPSSGFDFDENSSDESIVPKIATGRLNLTALSQRSNIYAIAYGSTIHIHRVRSCVDHSFPAHPDLLLEPPISEQALQISGYIDRHEPHFMNHLIMGDFGNEEIILVAFDDGDVIGYYTSIIENRLLYLESGHSPNGVDPVQPFFHQNVGMSAWGLAVHKQSRLIAVGTNKHEIHVFMPALVHGSKLNWIIVGTKDTFITLKTSKIKSGESDNFGTIPPHCKRQADYHLIFETTPAGNNMPSVAFTSDADGRAAAVLGVDISGNLWAADIWSFRPIELVKGLYSAFEETEMARNHSRVELAEAFRGWGVLVLPESSFLPTRTFKESLGISPIEAKYVWHGGYGYYIDIDAGIHHVKNNSDVHWLWRLNKVPHPSAGQIAQTFDISRCRWYNPCFDFDKDWDCTQDVAVDHPSSTPPPILPKDRGPNNYAKLSAHGCSVMRTYQMGAELVGGGDHTGIMFSGIINQKKYPRAIPTMNFPYERLSNLVHVPELSLVVAGSWCGRVALITLTRPMNPNYSFHRGFRVDAVLPWSADEDKQLRPFCPLFGVAIGPIPSATEGGILGERRYRLMIHYYNHRILSYEVHRDARTDDLLVN